MLEVKIFRKDSVFTGLLISGHAFMAKPGEDIVCASVSTLGFTLTNYFLEVLNISQENLNFHAIENEESSILSINIESENIYKNQRVQDGFNFFEIGLRSLIDEYSEYLELIYQEV